MSDTIKAREINVQKAIFWEKEILSIVDQTLLPGELRIIEITDLETAAEAICSLRVRGAPAIGVFAGYSLYGELKRRMTAHTISPENLNKESQDQYVLRFREELDSIAKHLNATRPTAVNLGAILQRMRSYFSNELSSHTVVADLLPKMREEAEKIAHEDEELCRKMGEYAATLIKDGDTVLTHCNAGSLATGGIGTAIGAFYTAHAQGKKIRVFADETRPLMQGARLTAWELERAGIEVCLITDNMAAHIMKEEKIDLVVVGADRIASNGDAANKIGTLGVAILAKHYNIPFYVVAPSTTIDLEIENGSQIPIEERNPEEVRSILLTQVASESTKVRNPAFDVTPVELITAIITEKGVHRSPIDFRKILA